jgi:hypothetical protein
VDNAQRNRENEMGIDVDRTRNQDSAQRMECGRKGEEGGSGNIAIDNRTIMARWRSSEVRAVCARLSGGDWLQRAPEAPMHSRTELAFHLFHLNIPQSTAPTKHIDQASHLPPKGTRSRGRACRDEKMRYVM